ncbi:MAG: DUF7694 domain-containing protein [Pseudomonadota bacterium]
MSTRLERRLAKKKAATFPETLKRVPREEWPDTREALNPRLASVWCSQRYLVQVFSEDDGVIRLSINSTTLKESGWADGITWDELMEIKRQCGYGACTAVEIYPDDANIVHVSNMRHLWVLPERPTFMWRKP